MKNIIITCGTSILNSKIIKNDEDLLLKIDEIESCDYNDIFINFFKKDNYKVLNSTKKITNFGVEINLLKKIYQKGDNVFLFFSDTKGGEIVKTILKGYFNTDYAKNLFEDENFKIKEENFINIIGFKIDNLDSFKNIGIPNFYKYLENIKNIINIEGKVGSFNSLVEKTKIETIMCSIGGYKSLIPYSSLYAMVNGWDIKYLYEDSDELMDLPGGSLSHYVTEIILKNIDRKIDTSNILNGDLINKNFSLENNIEILTALTNFKKSGDLTNFINLLENGKVKFKEIKKENGDITIFKKLDFYLKYCLLNNNELKGILESIEAINNKIGDEYYKSRIIKEILSEIKDLIDENEIEFKLGLLKWYKDKNRNLEFWLLAREFFIDLISLFALGKVYQHGEEKIDTGETNDKGKKKCLRYDILESSINLYFSDYEENNKFKYLKDFDEYKNGEEKIKTITKEKPEYKVLWNDIRKIRNNTAHVGKINFDEKFYLLDNYYEKLESFKKYVLTQKD